MSVNKDYYSIIHEASRSEDPLYDVVRELPLSLEAMDALIEFCYDSDNVPDAFEFLLSEDEGFARLLYEHRRRTYWELLYKAKVEYPSFSSGDESLYGERGYVTTLNKFESGSDIPHSHSDNKNKIQFEQFEIYGEDYKNDAAYIKLEKASVTFDGMNIKLRGTLNAISIDILLFIIPMDEKNKPFDAYSFSLETDQGEGIYEIEVYSPKVKRIVSNVVILMYYF